MPTVPPTHSVKPRSPHVYHNNDRCLERNNISADDIRQGTNGRPLCIHCSSLKAQGK
jgi:hypothetical protein